MTTKEKLQQYTQAKLNKFRGFMNRPANISPQTQNLMREASNLGGSFLKGASLGTINPFESNAFTRTALSNQPATKTNSTFGKVGGFVAEQAPMFLYGGMLGKAIKSAPAIRTAQKGLGGTASKLIAKGGTNKVLGRGIGNLSQGLPYTISFGAANKIANPQRNVGKGAVGDLAFDLATGTLPILGIGGMVGKSVLKNVNLPKGAGKNKLEDIFKFYGDDPGRIKYAKEQLIKQGNEIVSTKKVKDSRGEIVTNIKYRMKNKPEDILKAQEIKGKTGDLLSEAKKYKSAEEFVNYYSKNPNKIPTTPEYQKYLQEQDAFTKRELEIYAEMKAMREKYVGKTIKGVSPKEITKYDNLQKELNQTLSKKTLASSPEGVIKTHIGEKGLRSQLTDIWNQANKVGSGVNIPKDLGTQKVGKTQYIQKPQQETVSTKSLEFPYKDIIPQQKLLPAGKPKVYTPNQAKATFKRSGRVVPYKVTLKSGDSVINIPPGGWTGKKPYIEGKPITEVEAHQISQWEKEIGTKAYKKGIVSENFPSKALSTGNVKDKVALSYQIETLKRNVEETFGRGTKDTDSVNKYFLEPITKNETERARFVDSWKKDLTSKFKNLGITKKGSAEDMATADFIEGNITKEKLLTKFKGDTEKVDNIIKAAEIGRQEYRKLLKRINDTITPYGYKPIAEKQNYVTHTKQISELTNKFGSLLNIPKDKLPTEMAAIHMDTKPGRQFFKFGQHRVGGSTHEGLITALDSYIEPATNQIYHTGDIQRGRALIDYISKSNSGNTRLSNFNSYLSQYVDWIAGKKNVFDRPFEKVFGRRVLSAGDWARKRTGANMVGANITSALTNYIPFTQSIATTSKPAVVKGLFEGIQSPFKAVDDIDGVKSEYLARNFLGKDTLFPKFGESAVKKANILFDTVDKFTKRSVIAGKYFENLSKGLSPEDAMKAADDYGARVLVDRSYGQTPIIFGSKTLGMFTQFQTEVNNQMSFLLKDVPKNFGYNKVQVASALAQFAVLSYVFNNLYEKVTGRRPQIDVIHLVESYAQGLEEGKEPMKMLNPTDINAPVGEFVGNLPFNPAGGRLPISAAIPSVLDIASGKSTVGAELKKPLYYLVPPVGGGQLKKTIEGIGAGNRGYSETKSGDMRYLIPENRKLQTAIFGQYSTPEAREYFESGGKPLSEKQTSYVKQADDRKTSYQQVMDARKKNAEENKVREEVKKTGNMQETEDMYIYWDSDKGETASIKKNPDIKPPKLTGKSTLDKEILSDYQSKLSSRINDIVKLYELGQMTSEQAEQEIARISSMKEIVKRLNKSLTPKKGKVGKLSIPKIQSKSSSKAPKITSLKVPDSVKFNVKQKPATNFKVSKADLEKLRTGNV